MGLTGDPVTAGSRSGAMTHRNDQRSVSTPRGTSSEIAGNPRVQANRVDGQDGVGCQNSVTASELRFQSAASYSLINLLRMGRRRILPQIG